MKKSLLLGSVVVSIAVFLIAFGPQLWTAYRAVYHDVFWCEETDKYLSKKDRVRAAHQILESALQLNAGALSKDIDYNNCCKFSTHGEYYEVGIAQIASGNLAQKILINKSILHLEFQISTIFTIKKTTQKTGLPTKNICLAELRLFH